VRARSKAGLKSSSRGSPRRSKGARTTCSSCKKKVRRRRRESWKASRSPILLLGVPSPKKKTILRRSACRGAAFFDAPRAEPFTFFLKKKNSCSLKRIGRGKGKLESTPHLNMSRHDCTVAKLLCLPSITSGTATRLRPALFDLHNPRRANTIFFFSSTCQNPRASNFTQR
jgi:hypothetical protein